MKMTTLLNRNFDFEPWAEQQQPTGLIELTAKPEPVQSVAVNSASPVASRTIEELCGTATPSPVLVGNSQKQSSPTNTSGTNGFCQNSSRSQDTHSNLADASSSPENNQQTGSWTYLQPNEFPGCYTQEIKGSASPQNGEYGISLCGSANMFATEVSLSDAYSGVATKALLHSAPLPSQYYNTAVYVNNSQSLPYGMQASRNLCGSQSHFVAGGSFKGGSGAIPSGYQTLNPYFPPQPPPAPCYGGNYGTGQGLPTQPLDYVATYAYPNYYSGSYQPYPSYTSNIPTTTTTYQLAQLPPCTTLASVSDSGSASNGISDLSPFGKSETKKSKSKKKKPANPSPSPESEFERVFIWDLEETCVLFHSLLSGAYAAKFQKDCDQVHIDDIGIDDAAHDLTGYNFTGDGFQLAPGGPPLCLGGSGGMRSGVDWMRKLAIRYRRIREIYNLYKENVGGLLGVGKAEQWLQLRSDIETLTDSWHSLALKSLAVVSSRTRYTNVLVSNTHLVPSLAKILLYGLGPVIPIENIYSAAKIGREACFERILNRFGKKCTYVVVGSGREEETTAKQMQLPFWPVSAHKDLAVLHHALDLGHL